MNELETLMELPSERVEAGMTPSYREAISGPPLVVPSQRRTKNVWKARRADNRAAIKAVYTDPAVSMASSDQPNTLWFSGHV